MKTISDLLLPLLILLLLLAAGWKRLDALEGFIRGARQGMEVAVRMGALASCAAGPASPTPAAPSAASSSWAPPAWARPSWPRPWPKPSLTMSGT